MLSPEERLKRAAMSFGAWRERANKTKTMPDRIKFVHAENDLEKAAQAFFEQIKMEEDRRVKRRGNKN